jgi:adenine phosphoribosyltransferase
MSTGVFSDLRTFIRDIPDFPKPGILFKDITPLLGHPAAFSSCIAQLALRLASYRVEAIVGIESRGFIFGSALALKLGVGFVPIRKPGKLPWKTRRETYALEYGTDAVEIHEDAVAKGSRVAVVDDLLATGGTAGAAIRLLQSLDAQVVVAAFVLELGFLAGREKLQPTPVESLLVYE